jgi:hypothetical protein
MLQAKDNFFTDLENNMLSIRNISKIPEYNIIKKVPINSISNSDKKNIINNVNNIFYPKQRDQLFWIFYVILNSVYEYETTHNYFTKEKEMKFKWIEDFREKKEIFKPIKVSRNAIEDELANKHNINIFYIDNKKFYEMITDENNPVYVIEKINHKYGLKDNVSKENLDYYRIHYWQLENLDKPLKAVSSYKVSDLASICKKLNIICENMTKQKMYQEIMRFL